MKLKLSTPFRKLRFQMYAPILVLVFIMTGAALYLIYTTSAKFQLLEAKIKETADANDRLQEFSSYSADMKDLVLMYLTTKEEKYLEAIKDLNRSYKMSEPYEVVLTSNPSQDLAFALSSNLKDSHHRIEAMLKSIQERGPHETAEFIKSYSEISKGNKDRIEGLAVTSRTELDRVTRQMQIILDNSINSFLFVLVFVAFLLVLIAIAYSNQIYQPLIDLKRGFGELIKGRFPRLQNRPDTSSEVLEMFGDFNRMTEHLETSRQDLLRAQKDALKLAEIKSNFLSNMSHEIRTPLNSIIGLSDLLADLKLPRPAAQYVAGLNKNSAVLLSLVNDILDYSRLESGNVVLEDSALSLPQLLDRVLSVIRPAAEKKHIHLKLRMDPQLPKQIMGDAARLEQVLLNLLSNAVKFTEKGLIILGAEKSPHLDNFFRIYVQDTGIGVTKKVLAKLFQRFNQGEKTITKKYGGTGLGLAIVKQYVELMNGKVDVTSEVGRGSRFFIDLPLRPAAKPAKIEAPIKILGNEELSVSGKILLVDDSIDNRELVKIYLKDSDADITEAVDGREALLRFKEKRFDLVLLDMQMPEVDGYTAACQMRDWESKQETAQRTPIIAFTAFALKEEIQKALDSGCDGHLIKPVKKRELLSLLHSYLQVQPQAKNLRPETLNSSHQALDL